MCDEFLDEIKPNNVASLINSLCKEGNELPQLGEKKSEILRPLIAKGALLVDRSRLDL